MPSPTPPAPRSRRTRFELRGPLEIRPGPSLRRRQQQRLLLRVALGWALLAVLFAKFA